jgi:hypothetical protein
LSGPTTHPAPPSPARLESWKEIAAYLSRQVRTVQLWEKTEGLPVHRLPHKAKSSVFAYVHELDAWRARQSAPALTEAPPAAAPAPPAAVAPAAWRSWLAAAAILLAVVGLSWFAARWLRGGSAPASPLPLTRRYFAVAGRAGGRVRLIPAPRNAGQLYLASSPSGRTLVVAAANGQLERIDAATDTVVQRYTLPAGITTLVLGLDGHQAYLPASSGQLAILQLASGAVRTVPLQGAAGGAALSRDGRYLYIAMPYVGLERLDIATLQATHWIEPACPIDLAVAPAGDRIFVSFQCGGPGGSAGHDALGILNAANGAVMTHLLGPPRIGGALALAPDGNEIWVNDNGACALPGFDHKGCPFVPAAMVEVANLRDPGQWQTHAMAAPSEGQGFGPITFLPGGERALDGAIMLATTRLTPLEALPPPFVVNGAAVAGRDGAHLYVPVRAHGRDAVADFIPTPAACSPPTAGLLDWWPGDGSAADVWGMVNGHRSPTAAFVPGIAGQAFDLAAPRAFVAIGPDRALVRPLAGMTIAAWVNPGHPGAAPILSQMTPDGRAGWALGLDAKGRLRFCVGGGARDGCAPGARTVLHGSRPLAPRAWHAVAVVASLRRVTLFLDGAPDAAAPLPLGAPEVRAALLLGASPNRRRYLAGDLDEVMLYDHALASRQLRALAHTPACLAAAH